MTVFSCEEAARRLNDEIDGDLSFASRLRLRLHLWLCPPCASMRCSLRSTIEVLRSLGDRASDERGGRHG